MTPLARVETDRIKREIFRKFRIHYIHVRWRNEYDYTTTLITNKLGNCLSFMTLRCNKAKDNAPA